MPGLVVPGRLGKATSRTPSMHVDEKSDEAIVCAGQRMSQEGSPRKANRRQRRVEAHSTDAEGGLRGKGSAVRDSKWGPARGCHLTFVEQYPADSL